MLRIIKSSLFKLTKDITFKVTLFVGIGLAIFLNAIYLGLDAIDSSHTLTHHFCNGQTFLIQSFSPTQNFGITLPINLIVFTIAEFNNGTIRNEIIAGYKKSTIYFSLIFTGLIFTFALLSIYVGLSVGLSSIIGGFDLSNETNFFGVLNAEYLWKYVLMACMTYVLIASLSIFLATSIRNLGAAMPIIIILPLFLTLLSAIMGVKYVAYSEDSGEVVSRLGMLWLNPFHTFGRNMGGLLGGSGGNHISNSDFIASLIVPFYWSIIISALGFVIFKKRDLK